MAGYLLLALMASSLCGPLIIMTLFFLVADRSSSHMIKTVSKKGDEVVRSVIIFLITVVGLICNTIISTALFYTYSNHVIPDDIRCGTGLMALGIFMLGISVALNLCAGAIAYMYNLR